MPSNRRSESQLPFKSEVNAAQQTTDKAPPATATHLTGADALRRPVGEHTRLVIYLSEQC